jgi:filamentous hemagglutinin family protein
MSERIFRPLFLVMALALLPRASAANPAGGVVRFGNATISGQGTPVVNIQQRSNSAILSWQQFNIQPGEATHFQQPGPNAVALNRILDGQASQILGSLTGNGRVYLINPNGILFGKGATVDVHAFMAATDLHASDLKALTGGFDPSAVSAPGARIENNGTIRSGSGGFVFLVAPQVQNGQSGVVVSRGGEVTLAAGETVYLTDRPDGLGLVIPYTAPGKPGGAAFNLGKLVADAGLVRLRASIVAQNGVVEANSVRERNGQIELYADSSLSLGPGSLTAATGDSTGVSPGGTVSAYSADKVSMAKDATIDVSGGAEGGNGGSVEISARNSVEVSGHLRAGAAKGSTGGKIVVDPTNFTLDGSTSISGASQVTFSADQTLQVADGATIALDNQGDPSQDQTLELLSGRDVVFGQNATIQDLGTGRGGAKKWNVEVIAGAANPNDPNSQALAPGSDGGVYLSGVTRDPVSGAPTLGTNNGTISLTHGDLTVLAAGDVVLGTSGGLENVTGRIDVKAGRDVLFVATNQTSDSVIQNGSGPISVVAGGSVRLRSTPQDVGNAAIRTIGVSGTDAAGHATQANGGDILVVAQTGDVDAGVGNRWVEPGPAYSPADLTSIGQPKPPPFDVMPVVASHILGIGTEAGGNVTVIAGGNVQTRDPGVSRDGGTAEELSGSYSGSHIGVFGRPVYFDLDPLNGNERPVPIPGAPQSALIVIAGGNITGDLMVRYGTAMLRAGYNLAGSLDPTTVSAKDLLPFITAPNGLVQSARGLANAGVGWFGTLAIPVTVDLSQASVDALALNGIALRAIENPSLAYSSLALGDPRSAGGPQPQGTSAIASYQPTDKATLEAERGDVIMLGNDASLPFSSAGVPGRRTQDNLVYLLPPSLSVTTHHFTRTVSSVVPSETRDGELIFNAPFELFPSSSGKLNLDVAGQIRSAESASSTPVQVDLGQAAGAQVETVGNAANVAFTLPAGTLLRDPQTGLQFQLNSALSFLPHLSAIATGQQTADNVAFQAEPGPSNQTITIPMGTRVAALDGQIYQTTQSEAILPASRRTSQGVVEVELNAPTTTSEVLGSVEQPLLFTTPDGRLYQQVPGSAGFGVSFAVGQRVAFVHVIALQPGSDAGAFQLSPVTPLAGVETATNFQPTVRLAEADVPVQALVPGQIGNQDPFHIVGLVDPIPGILRVTSAARWGDGANATTVGLPSSNFATSTATSTQLGPVGNLAVGHILQLATTAGLPAAVSPSEVLFPVADTRSGGDILPTVFQAFPTDQAGNLTSTRPDPTPNFLPNVSPSNVWQAPSAKAPVGIAQSDAGPSLEPRFLNATIGIEPSLGQYFASCHAGIPCSVQFADPNKGGQLENALSGTGPIHAGDRGSDIVTAGDGIHRVTFDLAEQATITAVTGSLVDATIRVQQNQGSDLTTIDVPNGDAFFGFGEPSKIDQVTGLPTPISPDPSSSLQIAGPGAARLLVGVESFAAANAALAGTPGHQDGRITLDEFHGSFEAFDGLDRLHPSGIPLGYLDATVAPWVPTGNGGALELPTVQGTRIVGLQTTGNITNSKLPPGAASLTIVTGGDINLNSFGSVGSFQGGGIFIDSITGSFLGGTPPPKASQRGVFSVFATQGSASNPQAGSFPTGGGSIVIDTNDNFDIEGNALVSAAGGNILIKTRNGSIFAGGGAKFSNPQLFVTSSGDVVFTYLGSGISANGPVDLEAAQKVFIGAGITGATINIAAQNVVGGPGTLRSQGTINFNVSGSITGSIQAGGAIQVSGGGTFAQGANVSSASIVAGGGTAVASNTGTGRTSAETSLASQNTAENYAGGLGGGKAALTSAGPTDWRIEVSSGPCQGQDCN